MQVHQNIFVKDPNSFPPNAAQSPKNEKGDLKACTYIFISTTINPWSIHAETLNAYRGLEIIEWSIKGNALDMQRQRHGRGRSLQAHKKIEKQKTITYADMGHK